MSDDARLDAFFEQVVANIREHGTHVTWVGAGDDDPPFAYTTGLSARDQHPEFVLYGVGPEVSQSLLNALSATVLNGTERYGDGDWVDRLVANSVPVRLVALPDSSADLTVANALFREEGAPPIPALQLVFPDAAGLWPWQDGSKVANLPAKGAVPADDAGTRHIMPVTV